MRSTVREDRMAAVLAAWGQLVDVQPTRAGMLPGDTAAALRAAQAAVWDAYQLVTRDAVDAAFEAAVSSELPVDVWPVEDVAA